MDLYKSRLSVLLVCGGVNAAPVEPPELEIGEILDPLILTAFESGESLPLTDFAGKILYLEWFYWW